MGILRSWLDKCLNEHEQCRNPDVALPSRLLDVGPADGSQEPRIVCGAELTNERAKNLALSYCWGQKTKDSPWTLKKTHIDRFKIGIPSSQLPQSFRDIIKLTRALKERYVWIDALCILQDSPYDWAKEAASVARSYRNSLCTVILPASDPGLPFFVERKTLETTPATLQLTPRDGGSSAVVRLHPVLPRWTSEYDPGPGEKMGRT